MNSPYDSEAICFERTLTSATTSDASDIEKTAQSPEELADILPQTALGYDM